MTEGGWDDLGRLESMLMMLGTPRPIVANRNAMLKREMRTSAVSRQSGEKMKTELRRKV